VRAFKFGKKRVGRFVWKLLSGELRDGGDDDGEVSVIKS
jgi:hypothetical protein